MSRFLHIASLFRRTLPMFQQLLRVSGRGIAQVFRLCRRLPRPSLAFMRRLVPSRSMMAAGIVVTTFGLGHSLMERRPVGADVAQLAETGSSRPDAPPLPEGISVRIEGKVAMLVQVAMLQEAIQRLERVAGYTTVFEKHERINGELLERHSMAVKVRHAPFSVYMKVLTGDNTDRQILFPAASEGDRKDKVLVKLATLGGRIPAIALATDDPKIMVESRYPVTKAGILELARMALKFRQNDLTLGDRVKVQMRDDETFAGRPVYTFLVDYARPEDSPEYRKCLMQIDRELMVPVVATNWTWPDKVSNADGENGDQKTLLEHYSFRDIQLSETPKHSDFIATTYGF